MVVYGISYSFCQFYGVRVIYIIQGSEYLEERQWVLGVCCFFFYFVLGFNLFFLFLFVGGIQGVVVVIDSIVGSLVVLFFFVFVFVFVVLGIVECYR